MRDRRRVVLRNDFHSTLAVAYVAPDGQLSKSQVYRIRRALCGMSDCACGGDLGQRGPQPGGIEVESAPEMVDEGDRWGLTYWIVGLARDGEGESHAEG